MSARRTLTVGGAIALAATGAVTNHAAADGGGRPLATDLVGAEEAPGPGDPDATGSAMLRLNQGQGEVCYQLSWADVDGDVVAAHIHAAGAGVAGPVVIPLPTTGPGTGSSSGCVTADPAVIKAIRQSPSDYYVNVHSNVFPAGAVRGQLGD